MGPAKSVTDLQGVTPSSQSHIASPGPRSLPQIAMETVLFVILSQILVPDRSMEILLVCRLVSDIAPSPSPW